MNLLEEYDLIMYSDNIARLFESACVLLFLQINKLERKHKNKQVWNTATENQVNINSQL